GRDRGGRGDRRGHGPRSRNRGGGGRGGRGPRNGGRGNGSGIRLPPRPQVVARLDREGLLPPIAYIFSRAGCDGAVDQCRRSGLPRPNQITIGYATRPAAPSRGIAAHRAGMLPVLRHPVEVLCTRGLITNVYAPETLALGINMPARTVLLERLVKYNGETHADL